MAKTFSIIICTHNRSKLLSKALDTLEGQDFPHSDYEIVVVDDASPDDTEAVVKAKNLQCELRYLKSVKVGRAEARNIGLKAAQGDYVLFVDDDILAPPELLSRHLKILQHGDKIVGRGPIIDITEHAMPDKNDAGLKDFSMAFFCTCNASIKRETLLQLGGFDAGFTEYGWEDNEIGWRLRRSGYKVIFDSEALLYHYKPNLNPQDLPALVQKAQELGRSAVKFFLKHPHLQVRLTTNIHPVFFLWQRLTANALICKLGEKLWQQEDLTPNLRKFWGGRIFLYHYGETMRRALKEAHHAA